MNLLTSLYHSLIPRPIRVSFRTMAILNFGYGHWTSSRLQKSVAADGSALPWLTYPALTFLGQLDLSDCRVFEYGSGGSTIYWSRNAKEVVSVECHPKWAEVIGKQLPGNARIIQRSEKDSYARAIAEGGGEFDVIIIDGAWRFECAQIVPKFLKKTGLIILDNSDWYPKAHEFLAGCNEFIQVPFSGFAPAQAHTGTTTAFLSREFQLPRKSGKDLPTVPGAMPANHEDILPTF